MIRATQLMLLAVAAAFLCGCEKEVEHTTANLTGSWKGAFADQVAIIHLNGNGTFVIETTPDGTQGTQVFVSSGFGRLPWGGNWRVGDGEIVFSTERDGTTGGLEIGALYADRVLFKAGDGAVMYFHKVPGATPPAIPVGPPAGMGDEDEGGAEEEEEAMEGMGE